MHRAVLLLCAWAFDEAHLARIDWYAMVGNEASRRVAESCGVTVEGLLRRGQLHRGSRVDHWIGGMLPEDLRRGDRA
jgi:RimJ/RimL family protein N-acetyltransferase